MRNFADTRPVLEAVAAAEGNGEVFDLEDASLGLDLPADICAETLDVLDRTGLVRLTVDYGDYQESEITVAGHQYLSMGGEVGDDVLHFLPRRIDDLHARAALLEATVSLLGEYRDAIAAGEAAHHARGLIPAAFGQAVHELLAVDLFAAMASVIARISNEHSPACLAEEMMVVAILKRAEALLDRQLLQGHLDEIATEQAVCACYSIFELLGDSDVKELFKMKEPGDAALAGHSPTNRITGIVDQRLGAWFRPFFREFPLAGHLVIDYPPTPR